MSICLHLFPASVHDISLTVWELEKVESVLVGAMDFMIWVLHSEMAPFSWNSHNYCLLCYLRYIVNRREEIKSFPNHAYT